MTTVDSDFLRQFSQTERRDAINTLFEKPWITLYRCDGDENWFSALVAQERLAEALSDQSWDLHWGQMRPCLVTYGLGDDAEAKYERIQEDGIEPIVIARERDSGPFYVELAEDIRLFLNLFPNDEGNLVCAEGNGDEEVIARVNAEEVRIRKGPLLRYLQARQMYLSVYFDHVLHLEEFGKNPLPESEQQIDVREADRAWSFASCDDAGPPFSRLCGKRLLAPPPRQSGNQQSGDEDRFVDFVIGEDEMGNLREYSADPNGLANFFGKNPEAPNYLTQVHFKREVLDRYFHNPGKYEVSDGVVRNDPHWVFRIDNDHSGRVIAFLGDLGRDLPFTEQLHWRAHNILPDGGLSATAKSRSFDAEPADGEQPEHRFKIAFQRFKNIWFESNGWPLFRPLAPGDRHLLTKLHVPTSDNPAELDAQLLGLAKVLVDSLNDEGLNNALASTIPDERSLAKLERYLTYRNYPEIQRDVGALRTIQRLRSSGAAHARGSNYEKALQRRGLEGKPASLIVSVLIEDAIVMLNGFTTLCDD